MSIDWCIETFEELESTQDVLMRGVEDARYSEGKVVRAIRQTKGRGRHGRTWEESDGNLYFSFAISPNISADKVGHISLLTGLSLCQTISSIVTKTCTPLIKWPNDILIDKNKCAGILIETPAISSSGLIEHFVIGIGINVVSAPIEEAVSLSEYQCELEAEGILIAFLQHFDKNYSALKQRGFEPIRQEWLKNSFTAGQNITVKHDKQHIRGSFETVDLSGNLVILCDDTHKKRTVTCGDVFLV